jgi:hypothetical protein
MILRSIIYFTKQLEIHKMKKYDSVEKLCVDYKTFSFKMCDSRGIYFNIINRYYNKVHGRWFTLFSKF